MYIAGAMPKTPSRAKMNKVNHPKCFLIPEMEKLNRILRMTSDSFMLEIFILLIFHSYKLSSNI